MTGTIVKAISGFYYLESDGIVYECKAKGVFKNKGITPLVGDEAEFEPGIVTKILPRENSFDRPPVANVELMVIVMAAADPAPSFEILDRFILSAEQMKTDIVICVNKCDIASEGVLKKFKEIYTPIYPIYFVCGKENLDPGDKSNSSPLIFNQINELRQALLGKKAALAGPSGVGKSTLTNLLLERDESEIGEISKKSLRGKNTTRHSQLFNGDGFKLFDTPGFTSFDAKIEDESELEHLFPEFRNCIGKCRFDDCRHLSEPDCAVRSAVDEGKISQSRYESYKDIYKTIIENKKY